MTARESPMKLCVLVVDDERFVRFMLATLLRGAGCEVVEADSPEAALADVRSRPFHVVVTDVMMGAVDGFMLRDEVRRRNTAIPFVFRTALVNAGDQLMKRIREDPHSYYLSKSAGREEILDVLARATHVARTERARQEAETETSRSLVLASLVQRAALPLWADLAPRWRYGSFWQPLERVSGDLFVCEPLSPNVLLAVFGDISGHGTHAALAMMGVQVFLKQLAETLSPASVRPHRVLQELAGFFAQNLSGVAYMAGLVVVWDFAANEVRFHNAGYPDLVCRRAATGARLNLNPERRGSLPVGLLPDVRYGPEDDVTARFPDDAVFFVHSDGLPDLTADAAGARFVPATFLDETMQALAAECAHGKDVSELAVELYQAAVDCDYAVRQDDVFVFALAKAMPQDGVFVRAVVPEAADVDRAAQEAAAWAVAQFGSEELGLRLELLLGEHLMNIVCHGLDETARRHERILLFARKEPGKDLLAVKTLDRGTPWDSARRTQAAGERPDARLAAQNAALATHGRGHAMKWKLISDSRYRRLEGLNQNTLYVPLQADLTRAGDGRGEAGA